MYNRHIIIGNVAFDPKIMTTETSGKKFASIRVLTSYKKRLDSGELKEFTDGHNVVLWDHLADVVEKYVFKGQRVLCDGPSGTRKYQDSAGNDKFITEITAREFKMLSWRDDHAETERDRGQDPGYGQPQSTMGEDVPF